MDPRLQLAIENDDVDDLHRLIVEERNFLDHASKDPFPNTPLHVAAAAGKTQVAMELAILKPSFAQKLNLEGYSPMHLALQHEHYHTVRALMTLGTKLIRIRGRCGITPVHYVARKEGDIEVELLAEFLSACKSSIEDLTSRCEIAVHIAVKNHSIQAFKVLFGWLKRVYLTEILNWKDEVGNTVLHIAVSERQPKIIELLIGYININAKNFQNKSALQIFQANPSGNQDLADRLHRVGSAAKPPTLNLPLSQFLSMELTSFEKFTFWFGLRDESARNIILVVAALVTTATYQAALTPPGGCWGDNSSNPPANSTVVTANSSSIAVEKPHKAGNIILSGSRLYQFTALNSLVFLASIMTIWITAIPQLPHTLTVYGLMTFVGAAYFATLITEFPNPYALTGRFLSVFYMILLCVVLMVPLQLWSNNNRFRRRIDATWRRVGNFRN